MWRPQVYLHTTTLTQDKVVVSSTLAQHGGSGHAQPVVLGQAQTLRGLELAVMGEAARSGAHAALCDLPSSQCCRA